MDVELRLVFPSPVDLNVAQRLFFGVIGQLRQEIKAGAFFWPLDLTLGSSCRFQMETLSGGDVVVEFNAMNVMVELGQK